MLTCVDVAVFASVLRGDDGSYVCSGQGRESADLPVQTGDVTGVVRHLETRYTGAQIPPEWHTVSGSIRSPVRSQSRTGRRFTEGTL